MRGLKLFSPLILSQFVENRTRIASDDVEFRTFSKDILRDHFDSPEKINTNSVKHILYSMWLVD